LPSPHRPNSAAAAAGSRCCTTAAMLNRSGDADLLWILINLDFNNFGILINLIIHHYKVLLKH
jgi:hypothetical protein